MKYFFWLFLMHLTWSDAAHHSFSRNNKKNIEKIPSHSSRILIYNRSFAHRFHLDSKKSKQLTPGLSAIQVIINTKKNNHIFKYFCKLSLYLNHHLKIKFPENGPNGDLYAYETLRAEASSPLSQISESDRLASYKIGDLYNLKILLVNSSGKSRRIPNDSIYGLTFLRYRKNLFPGLHYISTEILCENLANLKSGASLWFEKKPLRSKKATYQKNKITEKMKKNLIQEKYHILSLPSAIYQWKPLQKAYLENQK